MNATRVIHQRQGALGRTPEAALLPVTNALAGAAVTCDEAVRRDPDGL